MGHNAGELALRIYFIFLTIRLCRFVRVRSGSRGGQTRQISVDLELEVVVSNLKWVLGLTLGSLGIAVWSFK